MTNHRWAPSSYLLGNTYSNSTLNLINYVSKRASDEGYGAIMTFNIRRSSDVDPMPVFKLCLTASAVVHFIVMTEIGHVMS